MSAPVESENKQPYRSSWEQAFDRKIEQVTESLSKLPAPNSIDNVNEWTQFIEERIQRCHEHLRQEIKRDLADWEKAMRTQALWQWVSTIAVITAYVLQNYLM